MNGRSTQPYTPAQIVAPYRLTQPALNPQPHYPIAPITTIDAVIPHQTHVRLFREGMKVAHIAKELGIGRGSVYRALDAAGLGMAGLRVAVTTAATELAQSLPPEDELG